MTIATRKRPAAAPLPSRVGVGVCILMLLLSLPALSQNAADRYAPHSVLATGHWAKISVAESGLYELTDSLLRAAGFEDPQAVKVYGYGGAMQPEALSPEYLVQTDDLPQVPTCIVGGKRLFHATGTVTWASDDATARTRNPYAVRACYFLSDRDGDEPLTLDSADFVGSFHPSPDDFHALYEVEDYAWYHGGRQLFDGRLFGKGVSRTYALPCHQSDQAVLRIVMSYKTYCDAEVLVDGEPRGHILVDESTTTGIMKKQFPDSYMKAAADTWAFTLDSLSQGDSLRVTISQVSGGDMRLDRIELRFSQPRPLPCLADVPQPRLEGTVANQDRHADSQADMVIIIPQTGKMQEEAERLARLHEVYDTMRVNIVRADELYNEFSSGTPDANAYRRYLKMLYDRAGTDVGKPRFLLLFGDAAWDNRMLVSDWRQYATDDFLLCYESEDSFSETACYVTDDFFGMLDDGDGKDIIKTDKSDVAIGRFPVREAGEAQVMVDKAWAYRLGANSGAWQNNICMMGDDGNSNMHMNDADSIARMVAKADAAYNIRKIYWDAYQRSTSATGYAYPDVERLIKEQMREGALIMNYSGHGAARSFSHEYVVTIDDFKSLVSPAMPLWFTASCDVCPFDGHEENIAEQAVLNREGGAIAFLGTTRTVYAQHNRALNRAFMSHVLSMDANGSPIAIGEAVRQAKNDQVQGSRTLQKAGINRLHYALLGDPALALRLPTRRAVVDSINGLDTDEGLQLLLAGDTATVSGHIEGAPDFQGVVTITVKDAEQTITCRLNPQSENEMPKAPLVYQDRPVTLFTGSDSVRNGSFRITVVLPKDISYADTPGQMLLYATDSTLSAHGHCEQFITAGADSYSPEGNGPDITVTVRTADGQQEPIFHADLYDEDGINASGSGIGHDMELVIDGQMRSTYILNSYFDYAFGDYRFGTVDFTLPQLSEGPHRLFFRAWDVLNNSAAVTLTFNIGTITAPSGIADISPSTFNLPPSTFNLPPSTFNLPPSTFDLSGRKSKTGTLLLRRMGDGTVKKIIGRRQ